MTEWMFVAYVLLWAVVFAFFAWWFWIAFRPEREPERKPRSAQPTPTPPTWRTSSKKHVVNERHSATTPVTTYGSDSPSSTYDFSSHDFSSSSDSGDCGSGGSGGSGGGDGGCGGGGGD